MTSDDIALLAEQEKGLGLQKTLTGIAKVRKKMGMKINIQKTECQFWGEGNKKFRLEVEGQELEQTENFVYLGGIISTQEGTDKDVERRTGLARETWQALGKVWNSKEQSKATKTRMYEVLVLSTLLYNAETWTLRQKQRLRVFEMACLWKIEGITRRDRIRNEETSNRLNIRIGIIDRIRNKHLRYFGHLNRMENERYPKIADNGYVHGARKRGRQKKRWIDMIKEDCKELHLTLHEATCRTQDRRVWRANIDERLTCAMASPGP